MMASMFARRRAFFQGNVQQRREFSYNNSRVEKKIPICDLIKSNLTCV